MRLLDVADLFSRFEILAGINFVTMGFLKISVLLCVLAVGLAQVLGLQSYRPLVFPLAALIVLLSLMYTESTVDMAAFTQSVYPLWVLPFEFLLPLITLITAAARNLSTRSQEER